MTQHVSTLGLAAGHLDFCGVEALCEMIHLLPQKAVIAECAGAGDDNAVLLQASSTA